VGQFSSWINDNNLPAMVINEQCFIHFRRRLLSSVFSCFSEQIEQIVLLGSVGGVERYSTAAHGSQRNGVSLYGPGHGVIWIFVGVHVS